MENITLTKNQPNANDTVTLEQPTRPEDHTSSGEMVFEIGLVMAGAVSAGAYTAGVIDFLMEALEAWQQVKDAEKDLPVEQRTVPFHNVRIKVLAGASAGGMTGAVMAAQIRNKAVGAPNPGLLKKVWVDDIDIESLLQDSDLKDKKNDIRSILDSSKITEIAQEAFHFDATKTSSEWQKIPYINDDLKLILTLSNIRGIPYEFKIEGESGFNYGMFNFADYEKATINQNTSSEQWERIKNAALATGAFPVGLSARLLQRDSGEYVNRSQEEKKEFISLKFNGQKNYSFTCVDGGVFNNEPLELAREELYKSTGRADEVKEMKDCEKEIREALPSGKIEETDDYKKYLQTLDRSIILIDPFPNIIKVNDEDDNEASLAIFRVIPRLIAALRRQAIFKPQELLVASHKEIYSSFMISPVRYTKDGKKAQFPIASGFLEGFGGFLLKGFRRHDYQLGRRNCQRFLERYFVVPAEKFNQNRIFSGVNGKLLSKYQVTADSKESTGDENIFYPIIPLMGSRNDEPTARYALNNGKTIEVTNMQHDEAKPEWPGYQTSEFSKLVKKISFRIKLVIRKLLPQNFIGWLIINSRWLAGALFLIALALFFTVRFRLTGTANFVFLSYAAIFFTLAAGMIATVAIVFFYIRGMILKRIKSTLRKQLQEYAFSDF